MSNGMQSAGAGESAGQGPTLTPGEYDELDDGVGEINAISVKAVELYQNQVMITDRLWSYFSQYSALIVILGLGFALFKDSTAVKSLSWGFLLVPVGAYIVFATGNHKTLGLTIDELHMVRSIAISQTRLKFTSQGKGKVMLFHLAMTAICLGVYAFACLYARGWL